MMTATATANSTPTTEQQELPPRFTAHIPTTATALIAYASQVHQAPATVTSQQINDLRRLGHSDRQLLDVVGLVALNHLTGSFNLVAGLHPEQENPS